MLCNEWGGFGSESAGRGGLDGLPDAAVRSPLVEVVADFVGVACLRVDVVGDLLALVPEDVGIFVAGAVEQDGDPHQLRSVSGEQPRRERLERRLVVVAVEVVEHPLGLEEPAFVEIEPELVGVV